MVSWTVRRQVRRANGGEQETPVTKAVVKRDNVIVRYFKETRAELRKVNWPTRKEAINLSLIVLGVTLFMSALLGVIDYLFSQFFSLIL
jgi:preprotein translocase subunit SecE